MAKTYKQIFGVNRVRKINVENIFGSQIIGIYSVLEKFINKKYEPKNIKSELERIYQKQEKYWGQIISIYTTIGALKIDDEGIIRKIPILEKANDEYNMGNQRPAEILLNYLLSEFQFPHPSLTSNSSESKTGQKLRSFKIVKPYISILSILSDLYSYNEKESYLTHEDIYFIDSQNELSGGEYLQIKNTPKIVFDILKQRETKNYYSFGFSNAVIKNITQYFQGYLEASVFLDFESTKKAPHDNIFCTLNLDLPNIINEIKSLIGLSSTGYYFDPSISHIDKKLRYDYSNYLYDINKINTFVENINVFDNNDFANSSGPNIKIPDFDNEKFEKAKVKYLLDKITSTDTPAKTSRRMEQNLMRKFYLQGKEYEECSICHESYPITSLTLAHIKKREHASEEDRLDTNIAMPACYLGCDHLFERGYIVVENGKYKFNQKLNLNKFKLTNAVENRINIIEGNNCNIWEERKKYFEFHRQLHQTN